MAPIGGGSGAPGAPADPDEADRWPVGTRVRHREWDGGQVVRAEPGQIVVLFDSVGYRTLATGIVAEAGLLTVEP